jgi:adenylate cyclase
MSSIAPVQPDNTLAPRTDTASLVLVDIGMRIKLHLMAAVAVVFLSVYGRVVCPFVDSVDIVQLAAGLCAVGVAQILLREALYMLFPRPWGRATLARHAMYIATLSWMVAGLIAMGLHMSLYPDFPISSHLKLLTGYWALGGGILSQLEFNMVERYLRERVGPEVDDGQSVERITRRLMESYAVFTIVPALILILAVFRQVHEGYGSLPEAMEVTFIGVVFVSAALFVAWRYGIALREDCRAIRTALLDVSSGKFTVDLDATRPDELGLVARGIADMGKGLAIREQRETKLLEITSAFSDELHLDRLLNIITVGATELLNAERSSLYLYDEPRDELWTPVAEGLSHGAIYLAKDSGLAGACFSAQQTINLPDVSIDPRFNPEMDRQTGFTTRNMLCIPVYNKDGKPLGVIQVLNHREGTASVAFDFRHEQLLKGIATQAATALENARLFEDVLNLKNYDESILKSLSNGVISVDPDLRVRKVNAAAERSLGWSEDTVVGTTLTALLEGENSWLAEAAANAREHHRADHSADVDLISTSGAKISVNVSIVPLQDVNDEFIGLLLVLEDLSGEKRIRGTMSRYMPRAVVDQVLDEHRDVLDGRAQTMTLLFTDIRSFTSIAEAIGPRATVTMLNEYFSDMVDVLDANGGILDKYIGDAIMALFGVPFGGECDEANAVRAANEMMLALERLNTRRERAGQQPLHHGIGINTGEAIAGNIGSAKRMDYTVIGDSVNLTARIESVTKNYGTSVLVSDLTLARLDDQTLFREVDRIRVKGKTAPVTLYESFSWRADRIDAREQEAFEVQRDALQAFRAQSWSEARERFVQAATLQPDDKIPPLYLQRIDHYQSHNPGENWDGVWTMDSK